MMKQHLKYLRALALTLLLSALLSVPALATAPTFEDVPETSVWHESVEYLARHEITFGVGGDRYAPDAPITVRQMVTMLCRALRVEDTLSDPAGYAGSACMLWAYRSGWVSQETWADPNGRVCRSAFYDIAFRALAIPVYSNELYPGGRELPPGENAWAMAERLGLCTEEEDGKALLSRGEAAEVLFQLLTQEITVEPPVPGELRVENREEGDLNDYLLELLRIPEPILTAFREAGWCYTVDSDYLADLSERLGMRCVGAADYQGKRIYVSDASATLHEFGHFLDWYLKQPSRREPLYQEAEAAVSLLRKYSLTNEREYFADCFAYWIKNRENADRMAALQSKAAGTYRYFETLESNGWRAV